MAEAAFNLAKTWQIPEPKSTEDLSLGVAALHAAIERFPEHDLASGALLDVARSYLRYSRYEDAAAAQ